MPRSLLVILNLTLVVLLTSACHREEPPPVVPPIASPLSAPSAAHPPQQATPSLSAQKPSAETLATAGPSAPLNSRRFLHEAMSAQLLELPTEALPAWRDSRGEKPTLLLLSNSPLLVPVPKAVRPEVATLLRQGTVTQIGERSLPYRPDPLLLPTMSVDAALRQGWFGRLVWAIPLPDPNQALSLDTFRKQLRDNGLAEQSEVDTLSLANNVFTGTLRDAPLTAAALPNLPELTGPVVVHIDLSYFEPLYKNEVSTPLLPIVGNTLKSLQGRNLKVLAVTISQSNLDQALALDVRFLGDLVATLVKQPERLDQPLPVNWQRKADTLYLENFFQKEMIRDTLLAMEKELPRDASVKFALFRSAAAHKEGGKAFDYLAKAVTLDKVYALEYLSLAGMAYEKQRPDEAMRMLTLASKAFPDHVHVKIQMAQLAQELGDTKTALHLVEQLQQLPWSPTYYPETPDYLKGFVEFLKQPPQSKPVDERSKP